MEDDFGNYYCLASNERNHHKAVIELSSEFAIFLQEMNTENSYRVSFDDVNGMMLYRAQWGVL